MKIEPIVINRIQTRHTSFQVDLHLENNITFLGGDSGTGRSTMFSFLKIDCQVKCNTIREKNFEAPRRESEN